MQQYMENRSQINGILVKSADMSYHLKQEITAKLKDGIDKTKNDIDSTQLICQSMTKYLQAKYPGPWIVVIGRKFTANIVHQPGFFLRASTEDYHILVMKLRLENPVKEKQQNPKKRRLTMTKAQKKERNQNNS